MSGKVIAKVWTFESESKAGKIYETLQYTDGESSCNCPGWTRRVAEDGSRSCRHTRLVDQGIADQECVSKNSYKPLDTVKEKLPNAATVLFGGDKPETPRKIQTRKPELRKIRWQQ